jgi:hypothetical protein
MVQFEKFKTIMRTNQAVDVLKLEYERVDEKYRQYKNASDAQVQLEQNLDEAAKLNKSPDEIQKLKKQFADQNKATQQLKLDEWEKNFLHKCKLEKIQEKNYDNFVFQSCCKKPLSCRPRKDSDADCFPCCTTAAGSKEEDPQSSKNEKGQTDNRPVCTGNPDWKTSTKMSTAPITWKFPRNKIEMKKICKLILTEKRKGVVKLESALTEPLKEYFGGRVSIHSIDFSSANINMLLWENVVCIM